MIAEVADAIREHAAEEAPNECCGFVLHDGERFTVRRMRNALCSPVEFFIDPHDQYVALNEIEEAGAEVVAIYHSHPRGTPKPSRDDRAFAARWPRVSMLICAEGVVRAYTASGEPL